MELMESVLELADLPVIFISAYGRDEAGAADYIVKLGDDAARRLYIFNKRGVDYRMPRPGRDCPTMLRPRWFPCRYRPRPSSAAAAGGRNRREARAQ